MASLHDPVRREVARIELPSTRHRMIWARAAVLSWFTIKILDILKESARKSRLQRGIQQCRQ